MQPHQVLIGGIGIAIVFAGYVLLPRPEERVTMLARDGLYESAAKQLSALQAAGDHRPHLLMQLHLLREKHGDQAGALSALRAYLSVRPDDLAAREKEAAILLQSGLLDRYLAALASLVAARPSSDRITRLLELYRLHGRFDDELRLMRASAGSKLLGLAHLERLGAILAERGEWAEARRWLELADRSAPPDATAGRLLLFDVLIEGGQIEQAYQRARVWMLAWRSPYLAGKLILRMARPGPAQASKLARLCVDAMPDSVFDIAGVLTRKGYVAISQQMLARWAEREPVPTGPQLQDYVYATLQAGDVQAPFLKMARLVRRRADPAIQAQLAEELTSTFGTAALAPFRSLLSTDVLLTRPLFAAQLSISEGNPYLARWFLAQTDPARLAPEQRMSWFILLRRLETRAALLDRLFRIWEEGHLPPELIRPFADEALQSGQVRLHDLIWASLRH